MSKPASAGSTEFSPQIEIRPEVSDDRSLDASAFNNANLGIAPNKNFAIIAAADMIIHF